MFVVVLFLVFLVLPLTELYVIIQVGGAIGIGWTLLLLLADSILGTVLLRSQGRTVWRRFNAAIAEGRMPHREVLDGALVILGGAFLLTPGFITDVFGVLLLLPPTRAIGRRLIMSRLGRHLAVRVTGAGRPRRYDVEGTASEHDGPENVGAQPAEPAASARPGRLER